MRIRFLLAPAVLMLVGPVTGADARAPEDPTALSRAGTAAIENHRFGEALEAFTKAAVLQPGDASHCFGAGVAAFMLGQNDVAQARFECALALKPNHLQAAVWLADLHYRAGRLREAIAIYDTAQRRSPGASELQEQLALWRQEQALQSRFREVRTDHFTVLFEVATDEPLAREAVKRLEAAYWRVGNTLGVYPTQPITVVLYSREQFGDITKLAAWSVAAYDGRIRVPLSSALEQHDELDRVLSHEFVHAVVAMIGGPHRAGMGERGPRHRARTSGPHGCGSGAGATERCASRALDDCTAASSISPRRDAEVAYGSAARAVRRLIEQRGAPAVVALLEDLARGARLPARSSSASRCATRISPRSRRAEIGVRGACDGPSPKADSPPDILAPCGLAS